MVGQLIAYLIGRTFFFFFNPMIYLLYFGFVIIGILKNPSNISSNVFSGENGGKTFIWCVWKKKIVGNKH